MDRERTGGTKEPLQTSETIVRVAPPITAAELLGQMISPDSDELQLSSKPLHIIAVSDPKTGSTEYLAIMNYQLTSEPLQQLLESIAPYKDPEFDKKAIIADWRMPDESDYFSRKLQEIHQGLGKHWSDFEMHRRYFLETIRLDHRLFRDTVNCAVTAERVKSDFLRGYYWNKWWRHSDFRGFRANFIELLREKFKGRKWLDRATDSEVGTHLLSQSRKFRANLLKGFFQNLDEQEQDKIIKSYLASRRKPYLVTENDQPGHIYVNNGSTKVISLGDGKIEVKLGYVFKGEAEIKQEDGYLRRRIIEETVQSANFLIPCIRWITSPEGQRELIVEPLPRKYSRLGLRLIKDSTRRNGLVFDERRINPLAGLLVTAYLSPESRSNWREKLGLIGSEYDQEMRSAQMPEFVLLVRQGILRRSPIFEAAEDHLKQTAE